MSKLSNLNYNHISVKPDSTVKLIQELSKLGVFKKKSKKRAKTSVADSIRQDSDMVGYTRSLGGPQIAPILQIEAGMTQNQIEEIQRRNDATFAALRGEVQQQRLEDIEAQQGQRFADITRLSEIMNPVLERFRGAQEPGAGQRIDPFTQSSNVILLPDITEERFTQTLNEGGPEAEERQQTTNFPQSATGGGGGPEPRLQPVEKIGLARGQTVRKVRATVAAQYNLGPPPILRETNRPQMEAYYRQLANNTGNDINDSLLGSKEKMFAEINSILDEYVQFKL
jgi:hypothetical protein